MNKVKGLTSPKWPTWLPLRDELRELTPYGAPQISDVVALNTNENPFQLPDAVQSAIVEEVRTVAHSLNRYPDRDAVRLRSKLADYINSLHNTAFSLENIWAANGSNEILQTLFLACGGAGRTALGFAPSYSVYPLISRITGTSWKSTERDSEFHLDTDRAVQEIVESAPSLVILTSPNNPSGTSTGIAVIEQLARATAQAGSLFIVDEAYAEFSQERSAVTLISQFPHLVVARTMSKAFAFAGARVGYLVASPEVVDAALVTRLPYHLGSLTQAAAEVAIDHAPIMQQGLKELMSERDRLASAVSDVGWRSLESSGNFLLITGFSDSSKAVWKKFLDRGVLIRDIGLEGYVRVTVGRPQENTQFIAALREIAQ